MKRDLLIEVEDSNSKETPHTNSNGTSSNRINQCRKRKVTSWQRGFLNNKKKRRRDQGSLNDVEQV